MYILVLTELLWLKSVHFDVLYIIIIMTLCVYLVRYVQLYALHSAMYMYIIIHVFK